MEIPCKACGAKNPMGAVFCRTCGEKLDMADLKPDAIKKKKGAKVNRLVVNRILTLCFILALAAVTVAAFMKNGGDFEIDEPGDEANVLGKKLYAKLEGKASSITKLEFTALTLNQTLKMWIDSAEIEADPDAYFSVIGRGAVVEIIDDKIRLTLLSELNAIGMKKNIYAVVDYLPEGEGESFTMTPVSVKQGLLPFPLGLGEMVTDKIEETLFSGDFSTLRESVKSIEINDDKIVVLFNKPKKKSTK